MVNDDLKCIFLHPNKCGGKSVATAIWRIDTKVGSADHTLPDTHIQRFGRETWDSYWKFGFTRNPWDRLVSIYTGSIQIMQQNGLGEFGHFVRNTVTGEQIRDKYDVRLQSEYFHFEDKPIDFIGRFEHYEEDWKVVQEKLGIKAKLPHENQSDRPQYTEFYRNKKLIDLVADFYARDIELYGYEFGK